MKITNLFSEKKAVISLEVFPPKKTSSLDSVYRTLESVRDLSPDFVSVTYGAGGNPADDSTLRIAKSIRDNFGLTPLAHLTCISSKPAQIETTLDALEHAGIENILALRGDKSPDAPQGAGYRYARDLVEKISARGYFDIAAACYPEGHAECQSLDTDLLHLKEKVDAGATHLISQLFFDNDDFYSFLYRARERGITVPIQAGIMPVTNKSQIERMVSLCGASIPKKLARLIGRYGADADAMRDAGIAYATEQVIDLLSRGVQGIHLYTMNSPEVARRVSSSIGSIVRCLNG